MNILLVYKKSTYQIYFRERGLTAEVAGFLPEDMRRLQESDTAHRESLAAVEAAIRERDLPFRSVYRARLTNYAPHDIVIAVGGDGTFFEAARPVTNQILFGVNSDPARSVGHYCRATDSTVGAYLDAIATGRAHITKLSRLAASIDDGPTVHVTNDILFSHRVPAALTKYELSIDDHCEIHRGSGLWVSTPSGSTGAIAAAGGTVLPMDSTAFHYRPRELSMLRNAHYQFLGGVISDGGVLRLTSLLREGMIYCDGSHQRMPLSLRQTIAIQQSSLPLRVILGIDA
ncbi:MAG TPA: hypothetical protein DCR55_03115 [Lentisphaeria bacterium]|nr:hypothetical protein [Lentisphaeria bacterium]